MMSNTELDYAHSKAIAMAPNFYFVDEDWGATQRVSVAVQISGSTLDAEIAERYTQILARLAESQIFVVAHDRESKDPAGLVATLSVEDLLDATMEMSWINYCVLPGSNQGPSLLVTDWDYRLLVGDREMLSSLTESLAEDRQDFLTYLDRPDTFGYRDTYLRVARQTAWIDARDDG